MENLTELLEQFKAETKQQAIRLTAQRSDRITATSSKFGGLPYLPKNFAYPTDVNGNPLKLLAQLNFGELPRLANFPTSGILQFFVLPDYYIGFDYHKTINNGKYKVIYHEEIHENDRITDFPEIKFVGRENDEWFPFEGEFAVTGELVDISANPQVFDFDDKFKPFCEKHGINYYQSSENYDEIEEYLMLEGWHLIGGFPWFWQEDPRYGKENLRKYDTLLFQMSSDFGKEIPRKDEIMWGDSGVANFFINHTDLRNLKFDDVLYNWDCG